MTHFWNSIVFCLSCWLNFTKYRNFDFVIVFMYTLPFRFILCRLSPLPPTPWVEFSIFGCLEASMLSPLLPCPVLCPKSLGGNETAVCRQPTRNVRKMYARMYAKVYAKTTARTTARMTARMSARMYITSVTQTDQHSQHVHTTLQYQFVSLVTKQY